MMVQIPKDERELPPERLTVGDGFRVACGFWLFHLVLGVVFAVFWFLMGAAIWRYILTGGGGY